MCVRVRRGRVGVCPEMIVYIGVRIGVCLSLSEGVCTYIYRYMCGVCVCVRVWVVCEGGVLRACACGGVHDVCVSLDLLKNSRSVCVGMRLVVFVWVTLCAAVALPSVDCVAFVQAFVQHLSITDMEKPFKFKCLSRWLSNKEMERTPNRNESFTKPWDRLENPCETRARFFYRCRER